MTRVEEIFEQAKKLAEEQGEWDVYAIGPGVTSGGFFYAHARLEISLESTSARYRTVERIAICADKFKVFQAEKEGTRLTVTVYTSGEWEKLLI